MSFFQEIELMVDDLEGNSLKVIPVYKPYRITVSVTLNTSIKDFRLALGFCTMENVSLRTIWSNPVLLKKGNYQFIISEERTLCLLEII